MAGQFATLQFGNPGLLDAGGVVIRGAGDGIRVSVQATDSQADFRGRLTAANDRVSYPAEFAEKGLFHFRALPVIPAGVQAGEYQGGPGLRGDVPVKGAGMMNNVPDQRGMPCRLSLLALMVAFFSGSVRAGEKLDMFFIQGGSRTDPAVWAALNSTYAPGRYLVDQPLNGQDLGKQVLDVTPQDSEALCLPDTWLAKTGVNIRADFFKDGYDAERQCHVLTKGLSAWVDFDMSTQSLALTLPQQGLAKRAVGLRDQCAAGELQPERQQGAEHNTGFGSTDLKANMGHWVVSATASGSTGDSGNSATKAMFTASRAIQALNANLLLGR